MEQVLRIALENTRWDPEAAQRYAKKEGLPDLPLEAYVRYAADVAKAEWLHAVQTVGVENLLDREWEARQMLGDHEKNLTEEVWAEVIRSERASKRASGPNRFMGLNDGAG